MAYNQQLYVETTGITYLKITSGEFSGIKYPCTAISYDMEINSIPKIVAYLGVGRSVLNPSVMYNPEDLMIYIQNRDETKRVTKFIECHIYEEEQEGNDTVIFKGYVVGCTVTYTASSKTGIGYKFFCLGFGASLYVTPISGYTEVAFSQMLDTRGSDKTLSFEEALKSGAEYMEQGVDMIPSIQEKYARLPIHKKLAGCVRTLRLLGSVRDDTEIFDDDEANNLDPDVMRTFGGNTRLRYKRLGGDECDEEFTRELAENMKEGLTSMSVWDTIQKIVSSADFALQLVPRWSCDELDDFKMEIMPVTAWAPRDVLTIDNSDVITITAKHESAGALNTPDIVLVNFNEIEGYTRYGSGAGLSNIYGIAAKDSKLEKALRSAVLTDSLNDILDKKGKKYRIRIFNAPRWLAGITSADGVVDNKDRNANKNPKAEMQSETLAEQQPANNTKLPEISRTATDNSESSSSEATANSNYDSSIADVKSAFDAANMLAKALFLYMYMIDDRVSVQLMPSLRFGKDPKRFFENSIGDTIIVDLTKAGTVKSNLKLKGVLRGISYEQSSAGASNSRYWLELERVRLADVTVPRVPCPIYSVAPKFSEGN